MDLLSFQWKTLTAKIKKCSKINDYLKYKIILITSLTEREIFFSLWCVHVGGGGGMKYATFFFIIIFPTDIEGYLQVFQELILTEFVAGSRDSVSMTKSDWL